MLADRNRPGDECKVKGSPPERPLRARLPPSNRRRTGYDSPPYDSVFSDTPVPAHTLTDLSFRDPPHPQPEGSEEDRAKGKLKALASDKGLIGDKLADSNGEEESGSRSQSSRAAQGGSVQREGSKGASKRIGPRGPISAAKDVDINGPSAKPHPAATDAGLPASAQRTGSKRRRYTSELSMSISKHFGSPRRNGGFTYDKGRVYSGLPLLEMVDAMMRANGKASTSKLEDADNTTGRKPKLGSSKLSKKE